VFKFEVKMIHSSQTIASARLARDSLRTGEEEVEATTSLIAFCQHQVLWYDSSIPRELQTGPPHDVPFAYRYSGIKTQPKLGKQASEQQNKTNIGSLVLVEVAFAKVFFKTIIMSISATRFVVARAMTRSRASAQQQKRGIVDYLTNYPDKVSRGRRRCCWTTLVFVFPF
jgi:hypothetical protein